MKISVLTLYPEIYMALDAGVIGKAIKKEFLNIEVINIRDFSLDKHKRCDDYAFGGGFGMVMTPQPIHGAILNVDPNRKALRIYLSPKGRTFNQKMSKDLAGYEHIVLLNGSFEGIDQRIIELDIDMELSIGDYILTSGDLASLVVINSISRHLDGVLGSQESLIEESFENNLLEYPQYTRPQEFCGLCVPEVLLNGNHKEIKEYRENKSLEITRANRPDLLKQ